MKLLFWLFPLGVIGLFLFAGYMAVTKEHADLGDSLARILGVTAVSGAISLAA